MTKPQSPRRRPRTQFRVPPPLVQRVGAGGFTGLDLLADEIGAAGLLFWQSFRDVELWSISHDRNGLFPPHQAGYRKSAIAALDSDRYGEAKPHLLILAEVLCASESIEALRIGEACAGLAGWFEGQGLLDCAVEFALAAYLSNPDQAGFAVRVARLSRMLAEYPRATSWFDYAIYLARRSEDWQAYAEAFAGLGNLYFQVGNLPRARYLHRRCLKVSSRNHLGEMVGAACHNLFVLEMDAGDTEAAEVWARKAVIAYPASSPCVVRLARDLARRWTFLGHFRRSLPLALEALNHFTVPVDRALVWADVARAAGGCREHVIFEDAWAETWVLVKRGVTEPYSADVLIDLAHGAASLGDTARAGHAAEKALSLARERKEGRTILEAEALIDSLHRVPSTAPQNVPQEDLPDFAGRLLRVLQAQRAGD